MKYLDKGSVVLTLVAAVGLTLCSAYCSMVGFTELVSNATVAVFGLAFFLEMGKISVTEILVRKYRQLNVIQWIFLPIALTLLMAISAVGSYGFFYSSFKSGRVDTESLTTDIQTQKQIEIEARATLAGLTKQIDETDPERAWTRNKLIQSLAPQMTEAQKALTQSISIGNEDQQKLLAAKVKAGGLQLLADKFGMKADDLAGYVVLFLVIVFDPLAVVLMSVVWGFLPVDNQVTKVVKHDKSAKFSVVKKTAKGQTKIKLVGKTTKGDPIYSYGNGKFGTTPISMKGTEIRRNVVKVNKTARRPVYATKR